MTEENNQYCHMQNECKLLQSVNNQYNEVVKQNKSLQKENQDMQNLLNGTITAFINIILGNSNKNPQKHTTPLNSTISMQKPKV